MDYLEFLEKGQEIGYVYQGEYSLVLVLSSYLMVVIGAFSSLGISKRYASSGTKKERYTWLLGGAFCMGLGIWTMHFVGMMAFRLPVPVSYDVKLTVLSFIPALFGGVMALMLIGGKWYSWLHICINGFLFAMGVEVMHFMGMAAMRMNADMLYDPLTFSVTSIVGIIFCICALSVKKITRSMGLKRIARWIINSLCVGAATSGTHYLAMQSIVFIPVAKGLEIEAFYETHIAVQIIFFVLALIFSTSFMAFLYRKLTYFKIDALEKRMQMEAVLNGVMDAIIAIDRKGTILLANPATETTFGYKVEECIGKNVSILMGSDLSEKHNDYLLSYIFTAQSTVIGRQRGVFAQKKDGTKLPIEIGITEIIQEGKSIFIGICRDVSARREAEELIEEHRQRLQELLIERTEQARLADQANETKSRFLANMSHELRTPLNAILGISEMLYEEAEEDGEEHLLEPLNRVNGAGKHLLKLINDILDLSKIEAGKIEFHIEDMNVVDFMNDIGLTIQPLAGSNNISLVYEDNLPNMKVDITRLKQVILNLMSNACKFTDNGEVKLEVSHEDNGDMLFAVTDTGIGITDEQIGRLFNDFQQADTSTTKEFGGTGLGLSICKKLLRMMDGDIDVKSESGKGSTFTARIPCKAKPKEIVQELKKNQGNNNSSTDPDNNQILVIDDDLMVRDLTTSGLEKEGYETISAANGEEGLRLARKLMPRAITLDINLPDISGWDVLAALKADPATSHIPVIVCTVKDKHERGMILGAVEHMTKPIDRKRLANILETHIGNKGEGNILVVEDNSSIRMTMKRNIEAQGYKAREAENGVIAMHRLRERIPDLVFLDLLMPEMDGFEVLDKMRANPAWVNIPVIIATSMDLSVEERTRLNTGTEFIFERGDMDIGIFAASLSMEIQKINK